MSQREIAEQAQGEMWAQAQPDEISSDDRKPTARQIYALARVLCGRAGEPWPETRAEAVSLIARLRST
jgi:hypothetical protein